MDIMKVLLTVAGTLSASLAFSTRLPIPSIHSKYALSPRSGYEEYGNSNEQQHGYEQIPDFTLFPEHGDSEERDFSPLFLTDNGPSYEYVQEEPMESHPAQGQNGVYYENGISYVNNGNSMRGPAAARAAYNPSGSAIEYQAPNFQNPSPGTTRRRDAAERLLSTHEGRDRILRPDFDSAVSQDNRYPQQHRPLTPVHRQISGAEAAEYMSMGSQASTYARDHGGIVQFVDNRSPIESRYDVDQDNPRAGEDRVPRLIYIQRPHRHASEQEWQAFTDHLDHQVELGLIDVANVRFVDKRQNPVTLITDQQRDAITPSNRTNPTASDAAEFQLYLNAFNVLQRNISDLLFPILDTILNGTNSSIVYNAAWSIYSDLTGSTTHIVGPFYHGLNCLDWIEAQYMNSTNSMNITDPALDEYLAVHQVLLDLYNYAWYNASDAINATGLSTDILRLSRYLLPTNQTLMPPDWVNASRAGLDDSYFTTYNQTMRPFPM